MKHSVKHLQNYFKNTLQIIWFVFLFNCIFDLSKTKNMKTSETYTRLWDGKILIANVISLNADKVIYYFNNRKNIIRENTNLFLSVFTKLN